MRRDRGFAIALVLVALVLIGALTAGAMFAALQELRAARNAVAMVRAGAAAEEGAAAVLGRWDATLLNALAAGDSAVVSGGGPAGPWTVTTTRLDESLFLLAAEGKDPSGTARQAFGLVAKLEIPEPDSLAALLAAGVAPVAAVLADGGDVIPAGWSCPPAGPAVAAVSTAAVARDPAFFAAVAALAARRGGVDSLPGTLAPGDLTLAGGRHLGLFAVAGDLTLTGGAEVVGAVVVRGRLRLQGVGGTTTGLVVAGDVEVVPGATPAVPAVRFSRCAAGRALRSAARGKRLPSRAYTPIY